MASSETVNENRIVAPDNHKAKKESFLKAHRLKSMSFSTTWRWMRLLGFKYDSRRKSFYVDGHKREDVVANRQIFYETYLTKLRPYCKQWIQCPMSTTRTIKGLDVGLGHSYFDIIQDEEVVEFHIDYWNRQQNQETTTTIQPTTSI